MAEQLHLAARVVFRSVVGWVFGRACSNRVCPKGRTRGNARESPGRRLPPRPFPNRHRDGPDWISTGRRRIERIHSSSISSRTSVWHPSLTAGCGSCTVHADHRPGRTASPHTRADSNGAGSTSIVGARHESSAVRGRDVTEIPEHLLKRSRERRAALVRRRYRGGTGRRRPEPRRRRRRHRKRPPRRPPRPVRQLGRGGGTGRPATPEARLAGGRRVQDAQADAVLGDGCARPAPDLGVHVRPRRHRPRPRRQRAARRSAPRCTASCAAATAAPAKAAWAIAFASGEVLATFPHIEDQIRFVYFGTAQLQHRRRR